MKRLCAELFQNLEMERRQDGFAARVFQNVELSLSKVRKHYEVAKKKEARAPRAREILLVNRLTSILKIQKAFRVKLSRNKLNLQRMKRQMMQKRAAKYGSLVKTSIKKIGPSYFFTEIYDKSDRGLKYLSFILKNVENPAQRHTVNFNLQENNLINTDGLELHEFLTRRLKLEKDNSLVLDFDSKENYVLLRDQKIEAFSSKLKKELTLAKKDTQSKSMLRDFILDQKLTSTRNKVENRILEFNLYYS